MNQQEMFAIGLEISKMVNEINQDTNKKIKIKIPQFNGGQDESKPSHHQSWQASQAGMDYSDIQYTRPETSSRKFVKTNSQKLKSKRLYISVDKQNNSIQKIDKKLIIPLKSGSKDSNRSLVWREWHETKSRSQFNSPRLSIQPSAQPQPPPVKIDITNVKDIFLDTDDESRDSFDMNQVVSFNMERRYVTTLKAWSDLNKIKYKMMDLQQKLQEKTNQALNSENVQQLLQMYKVQQLGLKSEFEQKIKDLEDDKGIKDILLSKVMNKNKVLILEKNRHLSLLKKKSKNKNNSFDFKDILSVIS